MVELKDIVNLDIYPIDQQGCDEYKKIVNQYSKELALTGCCSLPNFIKKTSPLRIQSHVLPEDEIDRLTTKYKNHVVNEKYLFIRLSCVIL